MDIALLVILAVCLSATMTAAGPIRSVQDVVNYIESHR